jgi:serine/threonine-protein kinase
LHSGRLTQIWRAAARNGTVVAVKTPASEWAEHAGAHEWLRREYSCLARLEHANIVRALDFVERRGRCALIMEYLGGGDLVPLAGTAAPHWIESVAALARALLHVHDRGYVHGDVKARNALFRDARARSAKLADFGSALPIGTPLAAEHGTAAHRPPMAGGRDRAAGPDADVYAFAVLLYELLTGRLPYGARPSMGSGEEAPRAPALPGPGETAALRALIRLVTDVLMAPEAAGTATLTNFSDVIEWVRKGS